MRFHLCHPLSAIVFVSFVCVATFAHAQETAEETQVDLPKRWVLIACGLPGDDEHRVRLTKACRQLISGAETTLGASPEQIRILAGDETMKNDLANEAIDVGICTKETMPATLSELGGLAQRRDGCWVFLLGHSHLYGLESKFNVAGPDFHQAEFAQWAEAIQCQEQVFWVTMPVSGFWIKPLSNDTRVIVSATEADAEFTGTEMPYALASHLAGSGDYYQLEDVDEDRSLSLLDLYLSVNLEIDATFKTLDRLQTEHAQLEDNGDGRGKEVQLPYLPVVVEDPEVTEDDEEVTEEIAAEDEEPNEDEAASNADASAEETPINPFGVRPEVTIQFESNMDGYRAQRILLRRPQ